MSATDAVACDEITSFSDEAPSAPKRARTFSESGLTLPVQFIDLCGDVQPYHPASLSLLTVDDDDELSEQHTAANEADDDYARWLRSTRSHEKRTVLPTSCEMARELNIRYLAGVDPGTVNAAFIVYDAFESRIVYWRVFRLDEIVRACELAEGVRLTRSDDGSDYRREALLYAISWWCAQDTCPLKRADLVCIESQDFMREMAAIESAWYTSLCRQRPALDVQLANNAGRFVVPKAYSVSAASVKHHFGSGWFPTCTGLARHASQPAWRNSSQRFIPHGVGDANRSATNSEQYKLNKQSSVKWCRALTSSKHAANDLTNAAVTGDWMSREQITATLKRLDGAKSDDLADALFIVMYAADSIVPSLWRRCRGPHASRYKQSAYVLNQPPQTQRRQPTATADACHQSLFVYAAQRARLTTDSLHELKQSLASPTTD